MLRFVILAVLFVGEVQSADVDTRKFSGVVFDAATPGQEYASITWHSDAVQGRRLLGFTTSPDGARHTYWFDTPSARRASSTRAPCARAVRRRFAASARPRRRVRAWTA